VLYAPRIAQLDASDRLVPPAGSSAWRLAVRSPGTLESLALADNPGALAPLESGQVRVAVHAAGLNFHDVVVALGLIPEDSEIGSEGAGVVVEVAPDVIDLEPGDRVLGLIPDCFGPLAVADRLRLTKIPQRWSFEQAASVPVVFLTAYHGLLDLAQLK